MSHAWYFEIRVLDVLGTACNIVQLSYAVFFVIGTGDRHRGRMLSKAILFGS